MAVFEKASTLGDIPFFTKKKRDYGRKSIFAELIRTQLAFFLGKNSCWLRSMDSHKILAETQRPKIVGSISWKVKECIKDLDFFKYTILVG